MIFGGVALLAIIYQIFVKNKSASMTLTHQGIQRLDGNYLISWSYLENIGVARAEAKKFVGLQLKPHAINSLPPNIQS